MDLLQLWQTQEILFALFAVYANVNIFMFKKIFMLTLSQELLCFRGLNLLHIPHFSNFRFPDYSHGNGDRGCSSYSFHTLHSHQYCPPHILPSKPQLKLIFAHILICQKNQAPTVLFEWLKFTTDASFYTPVMNYYLPIHLELLQLFYLIPKTSFCFYKIHSLSTDSKQQVLQSLLFWNLLYIFFTRKIVKSDSNLASTNFK